MGNRSSRITPINTECPICYDISTDMILLDCGHCFDHYCLQRSCIEYIHNNKSQTCPLCRTLINIKKLKQIYDTWLIESIQPSDWIQYNTIDIHRNLKIVKYNKITMENTQFGFPYDIIIPYYRHKSFDKPLFFHSPLIYHIEQVDNNHFNCLYDDEINSKFICSIDCLIYDSKHWELFLNTNFGTVKDSRTNLGLQIQFSKIKIRFLIKSYKNIIVYNEQEGTFKKGFYLMPQKCICLFRTYLIEKTNELYLINELYGILYK